MSLLGNVVGHVAAGVGRAEDYLTPGAGSGTLTDVGRAIYSPTSTLSNPAALNPFVQGSAFSVNSPATKSSGGGGQQQGAVTQTDPGTTYGGSAGSAGTAASRAAAQQNAANIAAYQDQFNALNQLLGSLDATQNNKTNAINSSYNNNLSILNDSQSRALSKLATQRNDTQTDYQKALQTINANARNGFNSLQMLLGGTGSAGNVLAPFAVSTAANKERGTSSDSYAKNLRGISTAEDDANNQYNLNKRSLDEAKNNGLQQLIASIDSQKQNYLSQRDAAQNQLNIAKGGKYVSNPSGSAITALLNEQAGLGDRFKTPDLSVNPVNVQAVDLGQYQSDAAKLAAGSNAADAVDDSDPAAQLAALLKQNQDQASAYSY